jgi:hypothetical protein
VFRYPVPGKRNSKRTVFLKVKIIKVAENKGIKNGD